MSLDIKKAYKFMKPVFTGSLVAIGVIFSFVPESVFTYGVIEVEWPIETIVIINRILWLVTLIFILACCKLYIWHKRTAVTIPGNGYKIIVEYGDIFEKADCKKVISFDECYTTHVGDLPSDIKASSICGQFLAKYPEEDFEQIIRSSGLKPTKKHSDYLKKECYKSGSLVPYNEYLLLAFTKLDKDGIGRMSREDFLQCLDTLWKELDRYHANQSVVIPILGSGVTRFNDETLSQQELLDMIIASYKLGPYKMKNPYELHIVCRKDENFSLNKIGEYI